MPGVETTPTTPAPAPPGKLAWLWSHRHTIAPILGVVLAISCPYLGPAAGVCKVVTTVVRTWSFDGMALP